MAFLKWLRSEGYEQPVLMVSALDTAKPAVEALQFGAADYLVKGFELEELRTRVANLLKLATLEQENDLLRRRLATEGQFGPMIGRSAGMRRAFEMADRVAARISPYRLRRERHGQRLVGTGNPREKPANGKGYVAVNCAALPETLIDRSLSVTNAAPSPARHNRKRGDLSRRMVESFSR